MVPAFGARSLPTFCWPISSTQLQRLAGLFCRQASGGVGSWLSLEPNTVPAEADPLKKRKCQNSSEANYFSIPHRILLGKQCWPRPHVRRLRPPQSWHKVISGEGVGRA